MKLLPYRNDALMLTLTAVSGFCLLVLVGLYFYSGSLLPSLQQEASKGGRLGVWLLWLAVVAVPIITGLFWIARTNQKRR